MSYLMGLLSKPFALRSQGFMRSMNCPRMDLCAEIIAFLSRPRVRYHSLRSHPMIAYPSGTSMASAYAVTWFVTKFLEATLLSMRSTMSLRNWCRICLRLSSCAALAARAACQVVTTAATARARVATTPMISTICITSSGMPRRLSRVFFGGQEGKAL